MTHTHDGTISGRKCFEKFEVATSKAILICLVEVFLARDAVHEKSDALSACSRITPSKAKHGRVIQQNVLQTQIDIAMSVTTSSLQNEAIPISRSRELQFEAGLAEPFVNEGDDEDKGPGTHWRE